MAVVSLPARRTIDTADIGFRRRWGVRRPGTAGGSARRTSPHPHRAALAQWLGREKSMRDLDREALFRLLSALAVTPRDIDERPALIGKPILPAVFKRPDRIAIPPPIVARMAKSNHNSLAEGFDRVNPRHFSQPIPGSLNLLDDDPRSLELRARKDEHQVVSPHDSVAFAVSDMPAGVFSVLRGSLIGREVKFVGLDR